MAHAQTIKSRDDNILFIFWLEDGTPRKPSLKKKVKITPVQKIHINMAIARKSPLILLSQSHSTNKPKAPLEKYKLVPVKIGFCTCFFCMDMRIAKIAISVAIEYGKSQSCLVSMCTN